MSPDENHLALEKAVMDLLLAGDDPVLKALREQYAQASVKRRMFSGVGFVTDFNVPADTGLVQANDLFFLTDVGADLNGQIAAGFHIQVKGGRLKLLEGFTYDDLWPPLMSFDAYYKYPAEVTQAHPGRMPQDRLMDHVRGAWSENAR